MMDKITKTKEEWQAQLSPEAYKVTRQAGTERAFSGEYHDCKDDGIYSCVCCELPLFDSQDKFDSGTGWPSYSTAIIHDYVASKSDNSFFMSRTEVLCARCDSHLGHVFTDGPLPTGLRYCINSVSLQLHSRADVPLDSVISKKK